MNEIFWVLCGIGIALFLAYVGDGIHIYLVVKAKKEAEKK